MIDESLYYRAAAELNKRQLEEILGSKPSADIKDPKAGLNEADRRQYVANIASVYPSVEAEIRYFLGEIIDFMARTSEAMPQLMFGRGNINFADKLIERFGALNAEHQENVQRAQNKEGGA